VTGVIKAMGPELLGELLDGHASALVLYARQWCATPEDVVQEAFVKLLGQRPTPGNAVAWLYRVVRNGAISAARSTRRRERHETAAARQTTWFQSADDTRLTSDEVVAALQNLPIEQREIIVAHLWGRRTFEQIAELVGASASSAHRWYVEGLTALRERLEAPWPKNSRPPS